MTRTKNKKTVCFIDCGLEGLTLFICLKSEQNIKLKHQMQFIIFVKMHPRPKHEIKHFQHLIKRQVILLLFLVVVMQSPGPLLPNLDQSPAVSSVQPNLLDSVKWLRHKVAWSWQRAEWRPISVISVTSFRTDTRFAWQGMTGLLQNTVGCLGTTSH